MERTNYVDSNYSVLLSFNRKGKRRNSEICFRAASRKLSLCFSAAQHENTKLPEIPGGEQTEVVAVFAMTSTPETEVQGNFINELKQKVQDSKALLRIVVDTSGFLARFANTPQRITERKRIGLISLLPTASVSLL